RCGSRPHGRPRQDDPCPAHCRTRRNARPRRILLLRPQTGRTKTKEETMSKFIIEPHFRLQEWVAEEKGYFKDEGLDYEFRELVKATDGKVHDKGDKVGAMQSLEAGRKSDVSCACHWTV